MATDKRCLYKMADIVKAYRDKKLSQMSTEERQYHTLILYYLEAELKKTVDEESNA